VKSVLFAAIVNCVPENMREMAEFAKARRAVGEVKVVGNYGTPIGKGVTVIDRSRSILTFSQT
jgi:hypothetical protein